MKKVGIVTHYYQSNNYGGNLQAYALATYINKVDGFSAEQICYNFLFNGAEIKKNKKFDTNSLKIELKHPFYSIKNILHNIKKKILKWSLKKQCQSILDFAFKNKFNRRNRCFASFNEGVIPHSEKVYSTNDIFECEKFYHIFITGSDQVWAGCNNVFTLGFVESKSKISYAASFGLDVIPDSQKMYFEHRLKDYLAISVRNESDKKIATGLTKSNVEVVLDPVFLLSVDEWNRVAPKQKVYEKKYVFCYLLGNNNIQKRLVRQFAHSKGLKLIVIPHFQDNTNKVLINEFFWGDKKIYSAGPSEFLSLIRDAEFVFTDSFHALTFSIIFHKQFFVFDRVSKYGDMNARQTDLLKSLNLLERFCDGIEKYNIEYINSLHNVDFNKVENDLVSKREFSKNFLINNLNKCGEEYNDYD